MGITVENISCQCGQSRTIDSVLEKYKLLYTVCRGSPKDLRIFLQKQQPVKKLDWPKIPNLGDKMVVQVLVF
jgi:hypothetical protein